MTKRKSFMNTLIEGWVCPKCGKVNAPWKPSCDCNDPRNHLSLETSYWCSDCKTKHKPTSEHPLCLFCIRFLHAPPPEGIYFDFKGWRFTPPFICLYCGIEVCSRQWASSRSCGLCDISHANHRLPYGRYFAGPHVLIDPESCPFLSEKGFVDPVDRDKYPPKRKPPPLKHRQVC